MGRRMARKIRQAQTRHSRKKYPHYSTVTHKDLIKRKNELKEKEPKFEKKLSYVFLFQCHIISLERKQKLSTTKESLI